MLDEKYVKCFGLLYELEVLGKRADFCSSRV
jgi:hypothetical protein